MATLNGNDSNNSLYGTTGADVINGLGGNDYLFGDAGADILDGGDGNDNLNGFLGADKMYGGNGGDSLESNDGDDLVIDGGAGVDSAFIDRTGTTVGLTFSIADSLVAQQLAKTSLVNIESLAFHGGSGNDRVTGGDLGNYIDGGAGNDVLVGGAMSDALIGGAGIDKLIAGGGDDHLYADGLDTRIHGGSGNDYLQMNLTGSSTDVSFSIADPSVVQHYGNTTLVGIERLDFFGGAGAYNITGGALNDILNGSGTLRGGGGNDQVRGYDGSDTLDGDAGNDQIFGGAGSDVIHGGIGDDQLDGGTDADSIYGDAGNDIITQYYDPTFGVNNVPDTLIDGGDGIDYLWLYNISSPDSLVFDFLGGVEQSFGGGTLRNVENLVLFGGAAADIVTGGVGYDQLNGNGGDDVLNGGGDGDAILGGDGADILHGDGGDDYVTGDAGNDIISGNLGKDRLVGGTGADIFVFSTLQDSRAGGGVRDTLVDFQQGADKLDVSALGITDFSQISFVTVKSGIIVYGDITGNGFDYSDFGLTMNHISSVSADDFIFA